MIGKPIAVTARPMLEMATLAREKLRSRKSDSGTSGSALLTACQMTKATRRTRPTPMSSGTEIQPVMVDQSYW